MTGQVTDPHARSADAVLDAHDVTPEGLSATEAARRRAEHGENRVTDDGGRAATAILLEQFDSVLIWVLLGAVALSVWVGHVVDAALIAVIVLANGAFGFVQDYRAERSLEALRELTAPTATVRRDGDVERVEATALVPGDVIEVSSGDVVPADARLVSTVDLEVDESALTGESVPVGKHPDPVPADAPLADRAPMVYAGTNVTRGRAVAVVTATGMRTEVGAIAGEIRRTRRSRTPLQGDLDTLGRRLGVGVLALAGLVVPLLLWRGTGAIQAGLTAISLAVAAIPEGLPAVVTVTLALGVRGMAEERALVRRLPAVEALGSVDVICTDKTGTLTRGEMAVTRVWTHAGVTRDPATTDDDAVRRLLHIGALCNDASPDAGDPTERALVEAADAAGIDVAALRAAHPRTDEVPFSSERKWMGTVHDGEGYVKGAPAVILDHATHRHTDGGPVPLTDEDRDRVRARVDAFADDALRVLAFAYTEDPATLDDSLVLVGIAGLIDPPREEVVDALAATSRAGIDVKMVTGDNVRTARAIADTLGIGGDVLEGRDLEAMDDDELRDRVEAVAVFARTSPSHKVRILRALRANGHLVAMTGDGVNDAPALKQADIGVAMGVRGTEVAKQAADIVLLDDNYATIERAVERGRAIFDNIWKFVAYLLSANVAEVLIVFLASLAGYLILPAVQLLWINLLTDGLPALALGTDPKAGDVMERPPRSPDRTIVDRGMLGVIAGTGVVTTVAMLAVMLVSLRGAATATAYAVTMVFTGFVVLEFAKLYVIRWLRGTPVASNPLLAGSVAASFLLQLAVLYTPLSAYFGAVPLAASDWGVLAVAVAACIPAYLAVAVLVRRHAPA